MLSLRTALFRSQPQNSLTRQSPRVPHLAHGKSPHKPPTPIMGRAFSMAPKLLQAPAEDKLDMVLNCTREEYMKLAGSLKRQRVRDECELFRWTSDRGLREKLKEVYVDDDKEWEMDFDDDYLIFSEAFERFESSCEEREMKKAGKEYDAQMARIKRESNLTESGVDKAKDED